jgi:hypothetical protein
MPQVLFVFIDISPLCSGMFFVACLLMPENMLGFKGVDSSVFCTQTFLFLSRIPGISFVAKARWVIETNFHYIPDLFK